MIKIYFRKPIKKFLDRLISRFVGKYIHVELLFSNGESFSSRGRNSKIPGRSKGVGFATINYSHPERWKVYNFINSKLEKALYSECERLSKLNLKYDYVGAIFQAGMQFTGLENKKKFYCNEVIAFVIDKILEPLNMKKAVKSPLHLCKELINKNIILE